MKVTIEFDIDLSVMLGVIGIVLSVVLGLAGIAVSIVLALF